MGQNPRNSEYVKEYNRKMLLRLLRREPMSRSELARRMGVTRAATAKMADALISEGIVRVTEGSRLGRASAPLTLDPEAAFGVGIYLNRDGCRIGLVDFCGQLRAQEQLTLEEIRPGEGLTGLIRALQQLIRPIPKEKLVGVGVCAPGPLDGERGIILNPPRFDLWHRMPIGDLLAQALEVPVYLENNASCLARFHQGKPEARGSEDYLLLLVDSGIGSGVISGGKVLKGAGYFTSELGHTSIDHSGRKCACGNTGCLETYAAIPNLLKDSGFACWKDLIEAFPDAQAQRLLREEAQYLAAGIGNLTNILSIDTVLLAGDPVCGSEIFLPMLEQAISQKNLRHESLPIGVYAARTGQDVWLQAAAEIAFGRFLQV